MPIAIEKPMELHYLNKMYLYCSQWPSSGWHVLNCSLLGHALKPYFCYEGERAALSPNEHWMLGQRARWLMEPGQGQREDRTRTTIDSRHVLLVLDAMPMRPEVAQLDGVAEVDPTVAAADSTTSSGSDEHMTPKQSCFGKNLDTSWS
eukprot:6490761-Amphidinium_carterae.5